MLEGALRLVYDGPELCNLLLNKAVMLEGALRYYDLIFEDLMN